jgi:hypothetical protein
VTGEPPAVTVAVRVTTLPELTVVTALPPEVIARVVVVAAGAAQAGSAPPLRTMHTPASRRATGPGTNAAFDFNRNAMFFIWMILRLKLSIEGHRPVLSRV